MVKKKMYVKSRRERINKVTNRKRSKTIETERQRQRVCNYPEGNTEIWFYAGEK